MPRIRLHPYVFAALLTTASTFWLMGCGDGNATHSAAHAGTGGRTSDGGANTAGSGAAGSGAQDSATGGSERDARPLDAGDADGGTPVSGDSTDAGAGSGAPAAKIVGGYYPNWPASPPRLRDVDGHYNLLYLFAATPVGGAPGTTGAVTFTLPGDGRGAATHFKEDIAYARATQRRKILMSVGGSGQGMSFPTRNKSTTFVNSMVALYQSIDPFDGMDWNTFEGDQAPDTAEMVWISQQLKQRYPGFLISAPPAPWNQRDQDFCKAMLTAGALDYAAPQYYDGPNLATEDYMTKNVAEWAALLGAPHVVVGFGIWDQPNYMKIQNAIATWKALGLALPALRGAFDWQIDTDETQGWPFAQRLGPLVSPGK